MPAALHSGTRWEHPIGAFRHIAEANARIFTLTGVDFGAGYQDMLAHGTTLMNSDDAARGLAALRSVAGTERQLAAASVMQEAFFHHGRRSLPHLVPGNTRWLGGGGITHRRRRSAARPHRAGVGTPCEVSRVHRIPCRAYQQPFTA